MAGELNGAAEQQQLLGQGGLAGVRMRDDGEGTPALDFGGKRRAVVAGTGRPDGNVHAAYLQGNALNSRHSETRVESERGPGLLDRELAVILGDVVEAGRAAGHCEQRGLRGRG